MIDHYRICIITDQPGQAAPSKRRFKNTADSEPEGYSQQREKERRNDIIKVGRKGSR